MRRYRSPIAVLLVASVVAGAAPLSLAAGSDTGDLGDAAVRLRTTARFAPIGSISGQARIDGRSFTGSALIWGGEILQSSSTDKLHVTLDGLGHITLGENAVARVNTAVHSDESLVIAYLLDGALNANLSSTTRAYVEAAGSRFLAAAGARFRIRIDDGHAILDDVTGHVDVDQAPAAQKYILRPPAGQGSSLSVAARSTRQLQIQVTDENDKPVADLPVLFSLGNPCLGTLGVGAGAGTLFKGKTDKNGIASVPWITGASRCADTILVRVEGTDSTFTYRAQVTTGAGFWTARNTTIVAAAAAGAGIGIGLAVANSSSSPIRAVPPPTVKP
jgi:hypothetical protein